MKPEQNTSHEISPIQDEAIRLPWVTPRFEVVDIATDTSSTIGGVAVDGVQNS